MWGQKTVSCSIKLHNSQQGANRLAKTSLRSMAEGHYHSSDPSIKNFFDEFICWTGKF